ncbi:hypothetical protein GJ744_002811 [Endocarpon pusillum]|uniref:Uncharacterized protein n=1 Tax=Endocarpon pusillum TaxID=364733 RepID=A0A8H7E8G2_9EURO|nr:hypothetical protein GJ744_002811 [Endocarpon pusillum]
MPIVSKATQDKGIRANTRGASDIDHPSAVRKGCRCFTISRAAEYGYTEAKEEERKRLVDQAQLGKREGLQPQQKCPMNKPRLQIKTSFSG